MFSKTHKRHIHVVSTSNMIKPASPTPPSLKHYNLSHADQFTPAIYMPFIFYYPNLMFSGIEQEETINRLKHSLSETLVHYYPFAGRLNSATYVNCNDAGVEFQEADIKLQMIDLLRGSDQDVGSLFPNGLIWGNMNENSPLLVVRLTKYMCGGLSIAVCLSHKLGDGKSLQNFMTSWAAKTQDINSIISPYFISTDNDNIVVPKLQVVEKEDQVTRRFLFPNSNLTKLKEIVARKSGLENITRFEVLTALLFKSAITAATKNSGFFTPSVLGLMLNARHKMLPPLPDTSIGNIFSIINVEIKSEKENNLSTIIEQIQKAKIGAKSFDAKQYLSQVQEFAQNNYNCLGCSSLCNLRFYRIDFGWGNPISVAIPDTSSSNTFFLMDTPDENGIEALVSLNEKTMTFFRPDESIQKRISAPKFIPSSL